MIQEVRVEPFANIAYYCTWNPHLILAKLGSLLLSLPKLVYLVTTHPVALSKNVEYIQNTFTKIVTTKTLQNILAICSDSNWSE